MDSVKSLVDHIADFDVIFKNNIPDKQIHSKQINVENSLSSFSMLSRDVSNI